MEFLKEILGEDLYNQVETKVNEHNLKPENKDKQIKIADLGSGKYVSKEKYETLETEKASLETEKADKDKIIKDLKEGTITKEEYDRKVKELEDSIEATKDDNIKNNIINSMYKEFNVIETEENKVAISAILKVDELKLNKEKTEVTGLKEAFEGLKNTNPHFFSNKLNGFEPGDKGNGKSETETNEAANIAQERNKAETMPHESKFFN